MHKSGEKHIKRGVDNMKYKKKGSHIKPNFEQLNVILKIGYQVIWIKE